LTGPEGCQAGGFVPFLFFNMDQDTFTKLVPMLHHLQGEASDVAVVIVVALLLAGAVFGFVLARWIFRGGLSRCVFRIRDLR